MIPWQDIVAAAACFSLAFALIPSIRNHNKPDIKSCLLSTICVTALAVVFASLGLWVSLAAEAAGVVTWGILLIQQWKRTL